MSVFGKIPIPPPPTVASAAMIVDAANNLTPDQLQQIVRSILLDKHADPDAFETWANATRYALWVNRTASNDPLFAVPTEAAGNPSHFPAVHEELK